MCARERTCGRKKKPRSEGLGVVTCFFQTHFFVFILKGIPLDDGVDKGTTIGVQTHKSSHQTLRGPQIFLRFCITCTRTYPRSTRAIACVENSSSWHVSTLPFSTGTNKHTHKGIILCETSIHIHRQPWLVWKQAPSKTSSVAELRKHT